MPPADERIRETFAGRSTICLAATAKRPITRKDASMRNPASAVCAAALVALWLISPAARIAAQQPARKAPPQPVLVAPAEPVQETAPLIETGPLKEPAPLKETAAKPVRTTPPPGEPTYVLVYKFRPGETVRTRVVHRATVDTAIQGTSQTAETRTSSIKVWKINNVASGGLITFVHSVESVDMWQQTQGHQEVRYNSLTDKEVPDAFKEVATQIGTPLTVMTMDRNGKVVRREEKLKQASVNSMPMAHVLAGEPVAVGAVWTTPLEPDVRQQDGTITKVKGRYRYFLEKVVDGVAVIQVEAQILSLIHDPAIEAQLIQRMPSGTIRFDIDAGRVLSQQLDLDKRVIGFSGPSSSMHCVTRLTEELLPADVEQVERLPPVSVNKRKSASGEPQTATRPGTLRR